MTPREVGSRLLAEAERLGVAGPRLGRRRRHPCLLGQFNGRPLIITYSTDCGCSRTFENTRCSLRRRMRQLAAL